MFGKNAFGPSPQPHQLELGDVTPYQFDSRRHTNDFRLQKVTPTNAYLWNWGTVIWTSAVFLLCPACAYFTLGALLCNIFAYVDHKAGDDAGKETKVRWAVAVSVFAFISGCVAVLIVLIVLFTVLGAQNWIPPLPDTI